jgi:hypothetical protein
MSWAIELGVAVVAGFVEDEVDPDDDGDDDFCGCLAVLDPAVDQQKVMVADVAAVVVASSSCFVAVAIDSL